MASSFALTGSYTATPSGAYPSGDPMVTASLDERMSLANELVSQLVLDSEGPTSIPLGGLDKVNLLVLKVAGNPVTVRLTSAAGTTQAIPVDTFLSLFSRGSDITAIDVTRTLGSLTTIKYFLGEKA